MNVFPEIPTLIAFSISAIILISLPGPALLFLMSTSIVSGKREAMKAMIGIETGTLFHISLCSTGLSTLILAYPEILHVFHYIGLIYFVVLGFKSIFGNAEMSSIVKKSPRGNSFREGLILNLFNPKGIIFFTVFLPQFIENDNVNIMVHSLILGVIFIIIACAIGLLMIYTTGYLGKYLNIHSSYLKRGKGTIYLLIALLTYFIS